MWSKEVLGYVTVDDLSDISSRGFSTHADFCKTDGKEIRGQNICFWNDKSGASKEAQRRLFAERMTTLEELFLAKYPSQGRDRPPPECPW